MAPVTIDRYIHLIPAVKHSPKHYLWSSYDAEADVLYVNFKKPSPAKRGSRCIGTCRR